ncbi:MAG: hypothetical protein JW904_13640 [Spirochaetales bacterium]|nr:hypothetical protein [Spirochaetales bacterium]
MRVLIGFVLISFCFACAASPVKTETPPVFAVSMKDGYVVAYNTENTSFSYIVPGKNLSLRQDKEVLFFFGTDPVIQQKNTPLFFIMNAEEIKNTPNEQILRKYMSWEFALRNSMFGNVLELGKNALFDSTSSPWLLWSYRPVSLKNTSPSKSIEYVVLAARLKDILCVFETVISGESDRTAGIENLKEVAASITLYDHPISTGEIKHMFAS